MKTTRLMAAAAVVALGAGLGYVAVDGASTTEAFAQSRAGSAVRVDNFRLADQNLMAHELYRLADSKAVVILTQANGDAAVRAAAPAFKALQAAYNDKGVEFRLLNSNLADTREAVQTELKTLGLDVAVMLDTNQLVGEQLNVDKAAELIVINPKTWTVAFRGALDNNAGAVIDAVSAGRAVSTRAKAAPGKAVAFPERARKYAYQNISYAETIAPIIKDKCAGCHQPGSIGPMALNTYEQIKGFAPMIRETIRTKRMPPYHADPTVAKYHDDKSLTPQQIKTLVHWIEAGAPRGAGADPLAAIKFQAAEWPLGKPDLVLDIPPHEIPATGIVDYQRPFAVNPMTEGRWLRASTIKVNERQAVHHILTGYMSKVPASARESNENNWGASVGQYAVGSESVIQPDNLGVWVPAGGAIGFQNHYTPFGKAVTDKSQIALYFYPKDKTPELMMRNGVIADPTIEIAPNAEHHPEVAYLTFPKDALLYSAFPHAHYRGGSAQVWLRAPDGSEKLLVALPKYDFNWQREYIFAEPVKVAAGSKIIARFTFDNSKRNPSNPDSNRVVPWGDQSFDEMLYTAIRYRWIDETTAKQTNYDDLLEQSQLLGIIDDNIDGKVQLSELKGQIGAPIKAAFPLLDADKNGALDEKEIAAAMRLMQGAGGGRG